ncbi:SWIB/MDM2 domain [Striga asiatica]|uniref:SWIB/MDM2 domain n=1 Tax=Striga asiatica TaxID=4170 RepID=A0A5A7PHY1_STRAF|nr:SWIB/MDM2 domain [Striga asiatica]
MDDNFWVEEFSGQASVCTKRKRRIGKKKIEFIGWASRPLIEFLQVIGKDTTVKHTQREVEAFITAYVNDKRLASAEKKKKILCDETLYALFGKKSMLRTKIYDLLEDHFAENHDETDDELDSSDEEDCARKSVSKRNLTCQMKVFKSPKSCFAAVVRENIKLVYLKRSLIEKLLKEPESFEFKMVGSFVRMKSDPNDIYQKNPFQLQQVTGVEKVPGAGDAVSEIRLKVSNFFKEIPVSMLSDENFSEVIIHLNLIILEEEIEDVRDRVKAGSLKRPTVKELEVKAKILHADITNHWIGRELSLLQDTLFDYIDRRKLLNTPSEREKLLLKIPEVIAEELEPEVKKTVTSEKADGSPKSILRMNSDASKTDTSGSRSIVVPAILTGKAQIGGVDTILPVNNPNDAVDEAAANIEQAMPVLNLLNDGKTKGPMEKQTQLATSDNLTVIDLSEDEDYNNNNNNVRESERAEDVIWHYFDPQGQVQGPFSLYSLKRWSDHNYFHSGFRVWKSGQTQNESVLLVDVLSRTFGNWE